MGYGTYIDDFFSFDPQNEGSDTLLSVSITLWLNLYISVNLAFSLLSSNVSNTKSLIVSVALDNGCNFVNKYSTLNWLTGSYTPILLGIDIYSRRFYLSRGDILPRNVNTNWFAHAVL